MNIFDFERLLLAQIEQIAAGASQTELAACHYLRGHISLAVGNCEMHGRTHVRDVEMGVKRSLQQACLYGELPDDELRLVETIWASLLRKVKSDLPSA